MEIAFCAFVDILGIGDRIRRERTRAGQEALAGEFRRVLQAGFSWIWEESMYGPRQLQARTFTDNVFLFIPFDYRSFDPEQESNLGWIMSQCASSQFNLALEGELIRGGLDVGFLEADDHGLIGSGLIRAYELETKAVFPRIVLSRRIAQMLAWHMSYYGDGMETPQERDVIWCADDCYIINYLDESRNYTEDGEPYVPYLEQHRDLILKGLLDNASNTRVFAKYEWLGAYHDWYCESVRLPGLFTGSVAERFRHMFKKLGEVLPRSTREEVSQLRSSGSMYELIDCPG